MALITKTYPTLGALRKAFDRLFITSTSLFWPTQEEFNLRAVKKINSSTNFATTVHSTIRIHHDVEPSSPGATTGYWAVID